MMSSTTAKPTEDSNGTAAPADLAELELTIRFCDLEPIDLICNEDLPIVTTLFQAMITNGRTHAPQQDNLIYLELGGDDPRVLYFHRSQILTIEANRPVSEDIIYGSETHSSMANHPALNTSPFEDSWKHWIWDNVNRGCSKEALFNILLEKGFAAEAIRFELGNNQGATAGCPATIFEGETPEWDMHDPDSNLTRLAATAIEAYEFNELLTPSECRKLVDIMKRDHTRSMVSSEESTTGVVDESRSSSSTFFDSTDSFIQQIEQKIADAIGIDNQYGEPIQGQKYEVGEFFKEHYDYFDKNNETIYQNYCQHGDRTWSLIVYLNDDGLEGGETYFPKADLLMKPALGKAVCWRNMSPDGIRNSSTLHSGLAPIRGTKYILSKWFREKPVIAEIDNSNKQYFSSADDLPHLDRKGVGFEKRKLPEHILKLVEEAYECLKPKLEQEQWKGITDFISDEKGENPCDIMSFDHFPEMKDKIHKELQTIVQEWVGVDNPIVPTDLYGIRSYKRGATLNMHGDRIETHHAGCVVVVDKCIDEDWPLYCVDHNGDTQKVYLEPGELVLYECAKTVHGRPEPMVGDWYRNFFAHYRLENWEYKAQDAAITE